MSDFEVIKRPFRNIRYSTILDVKAYCDKKQIPCELHEFLDGYAIVFPSGADIVQHYGSYGAHVCCVETAGFDPSIDYTAITYEQAILALSEYRSKITKKQ